MSILNKQNKCNTLDNKIKYDNIKKIINKQTKLIKLK